MLLLPNLTLECDDPFWIQMVALALRDCLGTWQPVQPTVLIVDEPWGCAFNYLPTVGKQTSIVLTRNPSKEYWEDLHVTLCPNVLLAGEQTLDTLWNALKLAKSEHYLKLTPNYELTLTPTELRVLHHLARIKTNKQIADIMGTAEGTIRNHISEIIRELRLCGREEGMLYYWGIAEIAKSLK